MWNQEKIQQGHLCPVYHWSEPMAAILISAALMKCYGFLPPKVSPLFGKELGVGGGLGIH